MVKTNIIDKPQAKSQSKSQSDPMGKGNLATDSWLKTCGLNLFDLIYTVDQCVSFSLAVTVAGAA